MLDYRDFFIAVKEMRSSQKAYDAKHFDKDLARKKRDEKIVDGMLKEFFGEKVPQKELFD